MFECPVCGHPMKVAPVDFAICGWCGVQFGETAYKVSPKVLQLWYNDAGKPQWEGGEPEWLTKKLQGE